MCIRDRQLVNKDEIHDLEPYIKPLYHSPGPLGFNVIPLKAAGWLLARGCELT